MSIPSPFSAGFPLKPTPFKSRTEQHLNNSKNYFAVAFKPGFPLQASELNEIQEIFYVRPFGYANDGRKQQTVLVQTRALENKRENSIINEEI